jgi:ketosteroid isomerase-like protein
MESSPELRDLTLRFYQALSTGDVSFLEQFLSQQPGVLNIGSDPTEWWSGYDTFLQVSKAQFQEMGGSLRVTGADPQAYSEGTVGWVADRASFELPDGTQFPFRLTAVYHKEDGAWKLVHSHNSVGVRNEEVMGRHLTVD